MTGSPSFSARALRDIDSIPGLVSDLCSLSGEYVNHVAQINEDDPYSYDQSSPARRKINALHDAAVPIWDVFIRSDHLRALHPSLDPLPPDVLRHHREDALISMLSLDLEEIALADILSGHRPQEWGDIVAERAPWMVAIDILSHQWRGNGQGPTLQQTTWMNRLLVCEGRFMPIHALEASVSPLWHHHAIALVLNKEQPSPPAVSHQDALNMLAAWSVPPCWKSIPLSSFWGDEMPLVTASRLVALWDLDPISAHARFGSLGTEGLRGNAATAWLTESISRLNVRSSDRVEHLLRAAVREQNIGIDVLLGLARMDDAEYGSPPTEIGPFEAALRQASADLSLRVLGASSQSPSIRLKM